MKTSYHYFFVPEYYEFNKRWVTNPLSLDTFSYCNRGENQALVGAIPFCGEYPGPRFKNKINFDQPIKWMEFQKLAEIKLLTVN